MRILTEVQHARLDSVHLSDAKVIDWSDPCSGPVLIRPEGHKAILMPNGRIVRINA